MQKACGDCRVAGSSVERRWPTPRSGKRPKKWDFMSIRVVSAPGGRPVRPGEAHGVDFLFVARIWEGEPAPLENTSEVGWFHPGALPPDSLPWLADVLDTHLRAGVWLSEQLG
ncbi:hypothetical protein ACFSC4_07030 [Deinococcus malanensis]|uniref:hypothetical protein n=1 Tax=Deinococcus malanensis TaxID=1706855 RepID=UPI00364059A6